MKNIIKVILVSGFFAGCASNTFINSAGVRVPTAELEAKYYRELGTYRKATFIQHYEGIDFLSNAYKITESKDEFRDMSWRWYYPQTRWQNVFGMINTYSNRFAIYFPKKNGKWLGPYLRTEYYGDDWLFFDTVSVKAGDKKAMVLTSGIFNTEREVGDGSVSEVYNDSEGAKEFLHYMKGVPDKAPIEIRLIATRRQNEHVSYYYRNNKPVIDEMLLLMK